MDTSPALLLLLALGFCCPGIFGQSLQIKVRSPVDINQLRVGQKLELECQTDKDSGTFWIHQDKSGNLHTIVFINSISRVTFQGNQKWSSRFQASKHNTVYHLAVKSFTPQDQGKYFCVMNLNQKLHFSPGQPVFLPATTVVAPTTPEPTPKRGITEDPNLNTLDPERIQEDLNFFCHIFIWVPLAGACLLLLIALVITIMLCQQTRRRRCRCKRPANGKPPAKPRTPN
ncbi:PREDICTED: T-cell surface glycoprotein CD8 alpha chain-like isoform X2 [Pseudopodoces humilis]|uniref:T-cell surface glycoprotein CD8 alpha chain-like isoform X2 n=1 Tax=Pseudopodoces humilis TaxID=181119 RepID=UPI000395C0E8|nr:PREDICTED: T-cell surface glycoprotein CD8 alpha chain-like isoform X2 [Pseudopodoces humilis]